MVFQKNSPETIEAAKRGGNTGKKYMQTLSKEKLKALSHRAGKLSGKKRRELALKRSTKRYEYKVMNGYRET